MLNMGVCGRLLLLMVCGLATFNCLTVAREAPAAKSRFLQFPEQSIGTLFVLERGPTTALLPESAAFTKVPGIPSWNARGRVSIPPLGETYLIASYYLIEHPEVLKNIDPTGLTCISFGKMGIMQPLDKVIEPLSHMSGLRRLELQYAEISDEKLIPLKALTHLEALDLNMSGVRGTCLKDFVSLTTLKELDLSDDRLVPGAFADIARLQNLRTLNLVRTGVTDDGMVQISKLKNLQTLYLANAHITPRSLKLLASMKALKTLELSDINFKAADLLCLAPLNLRRLFLPHKYAASDEKVLRKAMPQTEFSYVHETLNTDHKTLFAPLR